MENQTTMQHTMAYERTLLGIVHRLPPERIFQLVDFARFLEFQTIRSDDVGLNEEETETEEEIRASEAKWDQLFAKPKAKRVMREMARTDEKIASVLRSFSLL